MCCLDAWLAQVLTARRGPLNVAALACVPLLLVALVAACSATLLVLFDGGLLFVGRTASQELLPLPTMYLEYENPNGKPKKSWFTTFDARESSAGARFVVQRSQFGHFGIQQLPSAGGRLLHRFGVQFPGWSMWYGLVGFEVWNSEEGACSVVELGRGAQLSALVGEVSGCKLELATAWSPSLVSFMTTATIVDDKRVLLTAYYHDPADVSSAHNGWRLLGGVEVAKVDKRFAEAGLSAYIEQFEPVGVDAERLAGYGPQLVEEAGPVGRWVPIREATFTRTEGDDPRAFSIGKVSGDGSRFVMGSSGLGLADGDIPSGTKLRLTSLSDMYSPRVLGDFVRMRRQGVLPKGRRVIGGAGGVGGWWGWIGARLWSFFFGDPWLVVGATAFASVVGVCVHYSAGSCLGASGALGGYVKVSQEDVDPEVLGPFKTEGFVIPSPEGPPDVQEAD